MKNGKQWYSQMKLVNDIYISMTTWKSKMAQNCTDILSIVSMFTHVYTLS